MPIQAMVIMSWTRIVSKNWPKKPVGAVPIPLIALAMMKDSPSKRMNWKMATTKETKVLDKKNSVREIP